MKAANDNRAPQPLPIFTADEKGRFSTFIDKSGGPDACWPWTGAADPYGRFKCRGKALLSNRVAFSIANDNQLLNGEIVRHTCDNPPCCNPAHLVDGTYGDNVADMIDRGRANPARGEVHPRTAANDNLARDILESPLSGRKAAEHFDVSYGMVANIRARRTWKHVA
jgi:hypothetical protein